MPWIFPLPKHLFFLKYSTIGRENAKVLPEPVRSLTIKSSLLYAERKDSYYTGNKNSIPLFLSPSTVLG